MGGLIFGAGRGHRPRSTPWASRQTRSFGASKTTSRAATIWGLLTWVLAILAVVRLFAAPFPKSEHSRATWIFGGLALLSLAFAFGTPLYALLFYGLPGWNQLHSPFRWVFPFTVSMAVLGGLGLNALLELMVTQAGDWRIGRGLRRVRFRTVVRVMAGLMVAAGIGALAAVAVSLFVPAPFIGLGDKVLAGSDLARMAFADGRMFWSYQAMNLVKFGGFALGSGLLLAWMTVPGGMPHLRTQLPPKLARRFTLTGALAIALIVLDLFAAHGTFNPSTDPALSPLKNVPPVVQFINDREGIDSQSTQHATRNTPLPLHHLQPARRKDRQRQHRHGLRLAGHPGL